MSTQPRTPARWRSTLLAPTALACVASAGLAAEAPGREPASALQAEPDGDSAEQPDPGFEAPTTGATEPESEEPDGEGEEPEGEEEEGDVGGLEPMAVAGAVVRLAVVFFAAVLAVVLAVVFLAAARLRVTGPRARFSANSSNPRSGVSEAGSSPLRSVALVSPSVT